MTKVILGTILLLFLMNIFPSLKKEINYLNLKQKLEDGLITKNEYESAMYELLVEEYNLENVEFSILIQKLNIYSFLGYDLLSLLEEVLYAKKQISMFYCR